VVPKAYKPQEHHLRSQSEDSAWNNSSSNDGLPRDEGGMCVGARTKAIKSSDPEGIGCIGLQVPHPDLILGILLSIWRITGNLHVLDIHSLRDGALAITKANPSHRI